jgi:type IV secretory pathway TrbF-like protein
MKMIDKLKVFLNKKRNITHTSTSTENPYLTARRAWNTHVAGLMSSLQLWQTLGILGLMMGLAGVGGIIYVGSQSKFIPLVFQQDKDGNTLSVTRADRLPPATMIDFRSAVANFIISLRLVTPDIDLQRKAVLQTYSYLATSDPAIQKVNDYLKSNSDANPFVRAATETVSIEIRSVLQQSKDSWQIDWQESVRDRTGALKEAPYMMRALVTVYQNPPTSDDTNVEALHNPHFIFVRDYNWSKLL